MVALGESTEANQTARENTGVLLEEHNEHAEQSTANDRKSPTLSSKNSRGGGEKSQREKPKAKLLANAKPSKKLARPAQTEQANRGEDLYPARRAADHADFKKPTQDQVVRFKSDPCSGPAASFTFMCN